jgi:16S rRNA (guanine527-N7)-methyltransferase
VRLTATDEYVQYGLDATAQSRLSILGDLLLEAPFNVTSVSTAEEIERLHFLDSLSLLTIPQVQVARNIVDLGSGAGLPALVLALALPARVVAVESQRKKCAFIENAARLMELKNDLAVSRALASLPAVLEYSLPLLALGGHVVAMKGAISNQERIQGERAVGILGADSLVAAQLQPFKCAENRWAWMARKSRSTPERYPRRPGMPAKRPLGA